MRDCENCIHHTDEGCEKWKCDYKYKGEKTTAEWKIIGRTTLHYECSICGGAGDKWDKFCKHCGAKMEVDFTEESEEEE